MIPFFAGIVSCLGVFFRSRDVIAAMDFFTVPTLTFRVQ